MVSFVGDPPTVGELPPPDPDDPPPSSGTTYYVSTSGSDGNVGSIGSPFATLGKFLSVAADGDTAYCRGGSFGATELVISVPNVTIRRYNAEVPVFTVARAKIGFEINAAGVTINGLTLTGPGADIFGNAFGIYSDGTYDDLTVKFCTITDFDFSGVFVLSSSGGTDITITDNTIADCTYSGITVCAVGGNILRNNIQNIGADAEGSGSPDWNAYGIAVTGDQDGTPSSDVLVQDNYVDNVPPWHGLDTHGGQRVDFIHNEVRNCARAIFITNTNTVDATDCEISYNLCTDPLTSPNGTDANTAITTYSTHDCEVAFNHVGFAYPNINYDTGGISTGLSVHDNTRSESLPTYP